MLIKRREIVSGHEESWFGCLGYDIREAFKEATGLDRRRLARISRKWTASSMCAFQSVVYCLCPVSVGMKRNHHHPMNFALPAMLKAYKNFTRVGSKLRLIPGSNAKNYISFCAAYSSVTCLISETIHVLL